MRVQWTWGGALALALASTPLARAEDIKVLEGGGQTVPRAPTRLTFSGERGVPILQVLSRGAGVGMGYGGSVSSYGEATRRLCRTPCTLEVPSGLHEFKAGDSLLFSPPFEVTAEGQPQRWEVEDSNPALGVLGIVGTGVGLGGVLMGGLLGAKQSDLDDRAMMMTLAGVSAGVAAVGLWALIEAFSDADRVD